MTQETEREALFRRYFKLGQDMSALKAFNIVLDEAIDRASLGKGEAKPVDVGDTELAALVVEAFNKAEKPENHIGLCAGYRIAQAILSPYNVTKKEEV